VAVPARDTRAPLPGPAPEATWLEPFPDDLLPEAHAGTEARVGEREAVTPAFLVARFGLPAEVRDPSDGVAAAGAVPLARARRAA
jgi:hypothetical protein